MHYDPAQVAYPSPPIEDNNPQPMASWTHYQHLNLHTQSMLRNQAILQDPVKNQTVVKSASFGDLLVLVLHS